MRKAEKKSKEFLTGFKSAIEGESDQIKELPRKDEKDDVVLHLNYNLMLLEREMAFFNFAVQEITDIVS